MVKKIETIDDLIEVSGTAAAQLGGGRRPKPEATPPSSKPSPDAKLPRKTRRPTTTILDEVNKVSSRMPTQNELYPVDFDDLLEEPLALSNIHRKMSSEEAEKLIASAATRSKQYADIYDCRMAQGDSSRGFKIVSINILREAKALRKYLEIQKEAESA